MKSNIIRAKNKETGKVVEFIETTNRGDKGYQYETDYADKVFIPEQRFNNLFEIIDESEPEPVEEIKIVPSGRIDYCCECKMDHGYDCPKDKEEESPSEQGWEEISKSIREHVDREISREKMRGIANIKDGGRVMSETLLMNKIKSFIAQTLNDRSDEIRRQYHDLILRDRRERADIVCRAVAAHLRADYSESSKRLGDAIISIASKMQ